MIVLAEFNASSAGSLAGVLGAETKVLAELTAVEPAVAGRPAVVVVGPSVEQEAALRLAADLRTRQPQVGVILVARRPDSRLYALAMRAGARDVVADNRPGELAEALARVRQLTAALRPRGDAAPAAQLHAVFTAKGGDGKTTVAANLAAAFAARGGSRVALVDLDLASGDAAVAAGVTHQHTIADAVAMAATMDRGALLGLMARSAAGMDVLAAPHRPEQAEEVTPELWSRIQTLLAAEYEHVVFDCPPAFTGHVLEVVAAASSIILVVTPTATSLRAALSARATLARLGAPRPDQRLEIVLNRATLGAGITAADVGEVLNCPISIRLPDDVAVAAATNSGSVLTAAQPGHAVSTAMKALAESISPQPRPQADGGRQHLRARGKFRRRAAA